MRSKKPYEAHGLRISLVKEDGVKLAERLILQTPAEAAPILARFIGELNREVFVVAALDHPPSPDRVQRCFRGVASRPAPPARGVPAGDPALRALVLAHNHPSWDPRSSAEDISLTRRLVSAGQLLGIEMLDHIVLGEAGRFVSLEERGML